MILDLKDLICLILCIVGIIINKSSYEYSHIGQAMMIASIIGSVAVHSNRAYIRIREAINPKKMPPPKDKK